MTDFRKLAEKLADRLYDANVTLAYLNEKNLIDDEEPIMKTWEILADARNEIQEPKPEETEKSLKDAMKTAKSQGLFDEPETLTLKQLLKKWEFDFSAKWENPKNRTSELYDEEVERFIQMFEEWLPDAIVADIGRSQLWNGGYNAYRRTLMGKLK
jgi:hypothetical protein